MTVGDHYRNLNDRQAEAIARACLNPVDFAEVCLRQDLWDKQREMLRAVQQHDFVAVKACHASSKTRSAAILALWWLRRYAESIVITTAPTTRQLKELLWAEIRSLALNAAIPFPSPQRLKLEYSDKRFAFGFVPRLDKSGEGVRFQGFHGQHVLLLIDEAVGVHPSVYEAAEGLRAGGRVKEVRLGNPTVPGGPYYDCFSKERARWRCVTISAFDTPNLRINGRPLTIDDLRSMDEPLLDDNERPYLATRRWVRDRANGWGEDNPRYHSRVLGQFPTESEWAVFPLSWLEKTRQRRGDFIKHLPVYVGIDVAGPGDAETVAYARQQGNVIDMEAWPDHDPFHKCQRFLARWKENDLRINVDAEGIGWQFAMALQRAGWSNVRPVKWGEGARRKPGAWQTDGVEFDNLKAQMHWHVRELLREEAIAGMDDPKHETTIAQCSPIRYSEKRRTGDIVIEQKESLEARGIPSPDREEALVLAFGEDWMTRPKSGNVACAA